MRIQNFLALLLCAAWLSCASRTCADERIESRFRNLERILSEVRVDESARSQQLLRDLATEIAGLKYAIADLLAAPRDAPFGSRQSVSDVRQSVVPSFSGYAPSAASSMPVGPVDAQFFWTYFAQRAKPLPGTPLLDLNDGPTFSLADPSKPDELLARMAESQQKVQESAVGAKERLAKLDHEQALQHHSDENRRRLLAELEAVCKSLVDHEFAAQQVKANANRLATDLESLKTQRAQLETQGDPRQVRTTSDWKELDVAIRNTEALLTLAQSELGAWEANAAVLQQRKQYYERALDAAIPSPSAAPSLPQAPGSPPAPATMPTLTPMPSPGAVPSSLPQVATEPSN